MKGVTVFGLRPFQKLITDLSLVDNGLLATLGRTVGIVDLQYQCVAAELDCGARCLSGSGTTLITGGQGLKAYHVPSKTLLCEKDWGQRITLLDTNGSEVVAFDGESGKAAVFDATTLQCHSEFIPSFSHAVHFVDGRQIVGRSHRDVEIWTLIDGSRNQHTTRT